MDAKKPIPSLSSALATAAVALALTLPALPAGAEGGPPVEVVHLAASQVAPGSPFGVALAPGGQAALVVWRQQAPDASMRSVLLAGENPVTIGAPQVLLTPLGNGSAPRVAVDGAGRFVAAFDDVASGERFGSVYLARLSSDGVPLGAAERLTSQGVYPALAVASDGRAVVAWLAAELADPVPAAIGVATFDAAGRRQSEREIALRPGFDLGALEVGASDAPGHAYFALGRVENGESCSVTTSIHSVAIERRGWNGAPIGETAHFVPPTDDVCHGPWLVDVLGSSAGPLAHLFRSRRRGGEHRFVRFDPLTGAKPLRPLVRLRGSVEVAAGDRAGRFAVLESRAAGDEYRVIAHLFDPSGRRIAKRGLLRHPPWVRVVDAALAVDGTLIVLIRQANPDASVTLLVQRFDLR